MVSGRSLVTERSCADLKMVRLQEIWEQDFSQESHNAFHFCSITSSCRFGKHVAYKVSLSHFHSRRVIFQRFFPNKILLNIFSLLPAPLHVAYRDKSEDDDLEKAYKEVCLDSLSAMLAEFLAFLFTSSMIDRRQRFVKE